MKKRHFQTQEFLCYCQSRRRLSPLTVRSYSFALKHFNSFLDRYENLEDFIEVDKNVLDNYLISLSDYSIKTIKHRFASIRSMYSYLEYENKVSTNPFEHFHLNIRESHKIRSVMTLEEVGNLLDTAYMYKHVSLIKEYYEPPKYIFYSVLQGSTPTFDAEPHFLIFQLSLRKR